LGEGGDGGGVGGEVVQLLEEGFHFGGGGLVPDTFGGGVVMGEDLVHQRSAGGGEADAVGAAVLGMIVTFHPAFELHAIDQAGGIGTMHDQPSAEVRLGQALGMGMEEVEDIELGGAEVPAGEEDAGRIPEVLGGTQQLDQGLITGIAGGNTHGVWIHVDCLGVN
jgi:hypothetical protein